MLKEAFEGKKVLIWGYGREGKATENYIKTHCSPEKLEIYEGDISGINESDWDIIMKSPGIVMLESREKYSSETDLFLSEYRNQIIGVTGTKGKSTTSSLIYEGLKSAGKKCLLLGNIGLPCFDYIDEIDSDTIIVFELSCHQLLHIEKAPKYSVFLNIYPEHLDYYGTFDKYLAAKANIVFKQQKGDLAFVGENVRPVFEGKENVKSQVTVVNSYDGEISLSIPGEHNRLNAEFARKVLAAIGADSELGMKGISAFTGLSHRLEYLGERDGVRYYDDSISTIPEACINACESIPKVGVVLVGGMDRGIDYSKLVEYIKKRQDINFVLMYETGARIAKEVKACKNVIVATDLTEAVEKAKACVLPGDAVVLSPAAASYGYFKNFEERGDRFKELCL